MSKTNGKQPHKMKVVELVLDSGVRALVKPLTPYTRQAIYAKLADKFPYPDAKDFEERIGDSPGATIPITDETNVRYEEYKEAQEKADTARSKGYFEAVTETCVMWPDFENRDAMIKAFKSRLDELSGFMDLSDDQWLNTLYHAVCTSQGDINDIVTTVNGQLDIMEAEPTDDEIHTAWRVFRPRISRAERSRFNQYTPLLQKIAELRD